MPFGTDLGVFCWSIPIGVAKTLWILKLWSKVNTKSLKNLPHLPTVTLNLSWQVLSFSMRSMGFLRRVFRFFLDPIRVALLLLALTTMASLLAISVGISVLNRSSCDLFVSFIRIRRWRKGERGKNLLYAILESWTCVSPNRDGGRQGSHPCANPVVLSSVLHKYNK